MDNSPLTTGTKDDFFAHPSVEKMWNFANNSTSSSLRCFSNSKLREINDEESRFVPRARTVENNLDYHISFECESPCKEYSRESPRGSNAESFSNGERSTLENSKLTKVIATNGEGDLGITNENYSLEKIRSPDRKTSMFSKEIWTEKVLPIDTLVCPEPELVEIYFGNSKMNNHSRHCGNYGTQSTHSSAIRKNTNRDVLGKSVSKNRPSSARKGRLAASGQKTINFDDEIWPVCPMLIPSGKELSISTFENRPEVISPEKLTKNDGEALRPQCSLLKVASVFGASSKSSKEQYDTEHGSRTEKVIEPTHEIEGQNDLTANYATRKFEGNIHSRSAISQVNIATVEEPRKFNDTDRIYREPSPVVNLTDRTETNNFSVDLSNSLPLNEPKISQQLTQVKNSKENMKKGSKSSPSRTLKENPLSVSNSEPVSTILRDLLNGRKINSSHEPQLPAISCNEITSLVNVEVKQSNEDCASNMHAYSIVENVRQVSSTPVKNHEIVHDDFEESFHTQADMICKVSREVDESLQSMAISCRNKMHETRAELCSSDQDTCRKIHVAENQIMPLHAVPSSSKLPARESRNFPKSVDQPEMKKKRKCVKVVRFKTCDGRDDLRRNTVDTDLQRNSEDRDIGAAHNKVPLGPDYTNDVPDCISVESLKQEIGQLANQIARQIELDPALEDAVTILANIELIVEANRQAEEKLQQLQPHVTIPRLTPPDAGKSLAKALMRCRTHMQNNGYSRDATRTINKLLSCTVQNLNQLVEWQKLALVAQSTIAEKRCGVSGGHRQSRRSCEENSSNIKGVLTAEGFGTDQMQCLISDILTLTEKIVPRHRGNESQRKLSVAKYYSQDEAKKSTKNKSDARHTSSPEESNMTLEGHACRPIPLGVAEPKAKEGVKTTLEKPVTSSGISTNSGTSNDVQSMHLRANQRADKEVENTSVTRSSHSKKMASTDLPKTSKKSSNELRDKRSKTLPRHHNANDSMNYSQPRTSFQNTSTNQKLPAWKPGGNNFVQPSVTVVPNNQRIRPPPSSSTNKKKNATSEHIRDEKSHQHTKATRSIIENPSKISEQSMKEPYNTLSLAKMRTLPAGGHQSEVLSLDRSKVQVAAVGEETRTRKPRSKSRTRTRTPNVIPRMTVTEIPSEHANSRSPMTEQKPSVFKEFSLTKKASSSPRDIIHMLEELIKSSSNETSLHNISPVQVVARCDVTVKGVGKDVDWSAPSQTDVQLTNETDLTPSNEHNHSKTEESSGSLAVQSKSIEKVIQESKNTIKMIDDKFALSEEKGSVQDAVEKVDNLHTELNSIPRLSAEKISTASISKSEALSNCSLEGQTTPSASNIGCVAELSSEHSIGSVFSRCCQASLSSITSHEISEELICSRVSESGATSSCEKAQKYSQESFNTIEDDEVMRKNSAQQFHDDQSASANSKAAPRKKFVNKHAKSLEMLKEILSDQGLGIHLLSRAKNEARDRCRCSLSKGGLTARRSLQGAKSTTSKFSGESIDRVSLPYRNLSATLFSKLATLSESESDIEHVEVATMTATNDSTVSTNDCSTLARFNYHCSKEDKALSDKVVMIETATQFDVTSRSDMCVGDGTICSTSFATQDRRNHVHDSFPANTSLTASSLTKKSCETLSVDKSELFKCKLPEEILDAFRLAAVRAANFYKAVNILREKTLSESIAGSNSALKSDEIVTNLDTPKTSSASESPFNTNQIGSNNVRRRNTAFRNNGAIKSHLRTEEPKTSLPERIITPKIRVDKKNEANLERVEPSKPIVLSKPLFTEKRAFNTAKERKATLKGQSTDSDEMLTVETKSSRDRKIHNRAAFVEKESCQSSSLSRHDLGKDCKWNGGEVETLHFAGKRDASLVGTTVNAEFEQVIDSNPRPLNANFLNYGSPKGEEKIKDLPVGSRIRTLLKENLQLFETDCNAIMDEKVFTDFGDQLLTESSDDEELISEVVPETIPSTLQTHIEDSGIVSEVENLVKCLLDETEKNCDFSSTPEHQDLNTNSSWRNHLRQPVRKLKLRRKNSTIKRSMPCGKYFEGLGERIVSREQILSLIYAAICSFVFCCLQLSVRCEV